MNRTLAESHVEALRASIGNDPSELEALSVGVTVFLSVFCEVKMVAHIRKMLLRCAVKLSKRPFDGACIGKLLDADPVVQEAVVCYTSLDGTDDIEYPHVSGSFHLWAYDQERIGSAHVEHSEDVEMPRVRSSS